MANRTALVTGASSGIGAVYADRLARRGHDLVLVARDKAKLEALAARLKSRDRRRGRGAGGRPHRRSRPRQGRGASARTTSRIGILINNAGTTVPGGFSEPDLESLDKLIRLNVTAVTRLAAAVAPRLRGRGRGRHRQRGLGAGAGAGGLPRRLSRHQGLRADPVAVAAGRARPARRLCAGRAARRHAHRDLDACRPRREHDPGRDGGRRAGRRALVGFDRREPVTIPPLPDAAQWDAFSARGWRCCPNFRQSHAAARYRAA